MVETCVNIPEDRVSRVVGKGGRVKKTLERMGGVKLKIQDCLVTVTGEDGFKVAKAADAVKAIGLGFPLKRTFEIFKEDRQLVVFDIEEAVTNEAALRRQRGRIIGERGKTKKYFETVLGIKIHIGDRHVAAIGPPMKLRIFREALEKLVHGSPHSTVYRYVEARLADLSHLDVPNM